MRRVVLPDSFFAIDGLLETFITVLNQMVVNTAVIKAECAKYMPFLLTTTIMMNAVKKGIGREDAHEIIKEHAVATANDLRAGGISENDLLKRLLPEITTDMSEREVLFLLLEAPAFLQYDLESLRIPADGTYESLRIRGMEVLGVDLEENRRMLEERVYGTGEGGTDAASAR